MNEPKGTKATRFHELAYQRQGAGLWRIVTTEGGDAIGPLYRTEIELLCDLDRYATEYGCKS